MSIICEPTTCPNDPAFEHDNYFGCIPKDFSPTTGRSKTNHQTPGKGWNGGCDAACDHGPIELTHWQLVHVEEDRALFRCRRCGHEEWRTRE